jgi:hypothetical protein
VSQLPNGLETTLFFFGANTRSDPEKTIEKLEEFAAQGGRIVITFHTRTFFGPMGELDEDEKDGKTDAEDEDEDVEDKKCPSGGCGEHEGEVPPWHQRMISIADRWGFSFDRTRPKDCDGSICKMPAAKSAGPDILPAVLPWYSPLFFDEPDENWEVLYSRDKLAVVMERRWEKGSIVLCSDSYLVSNEAMVVERYPRLIAWLVGPSSTVILDEMHLGTMQQIGVMSLIRRYRLEGVLLAVVIVAGLFVWKNANSLTPKRDVVPSEYLPSAGGKDAAAALVNLLRRSVPASTLLSVCEAEWSRSMRIGGKRRERVQAVVDRERALGATERKPVEAYRTICGILKERD